MRPVLPTDIVVRAVCESELPQLLELYGHLHANDPPPPANADLWLLWRAMCRNPNLMHVVAELGGRLVATCALAIIQN